MATSWTAPGLLLIICLLPSSSLALHPRNAFKGSYDMAKLVAACPSLSRNLVPAHLSKGGRETIDFSDPDAVKCLNQAILTADYGIAEWSIPEGKLCPPIPGRADYVHHMADVLAFSARCKTVPLGPCVRGMDIGTGASLIYPLIGASAYGWSFLATETDPASAASAQRILKGNEGNDALSGIEVRVQASPGRVFQGVLAREDEVDFVMCNPPFYESETAFVDANRRKRDKLAANVKTRGGAVWSGPDGAVRSGVGSNNFGGVSSELWCPGGEVGFMQGMASESRVVAHQCPWFSSLVSQASNLPKILGFIEGIREVKLTKVIEMGQGSKKSSVVLWTFMGKEQHAVWARRRGWGQPPGY